MAQIGPERAATAEGALRGPNMCGRGWEATWLNLSLRSGDLTAKICWGLGFRGFGGVWEKFGGKNRGVAVIFTRVTLIGWLGSWWSIYRQVGWPVYANALGTPLARSVNTFVTVEVAYGLRFGRNFDRAQRVEPVDRTSLR